MAICGKDCSVSVSDGTAFEGHRWTLTANAPEIDVRTFASGDYGSWLACIKDGSVEIGTYLPISGMEPSDNSNIVLTVGSPAVQTLTCNDVKCTSVSIGVDAKGLAEYTYTFKLTGDVTGL